MEEQFVHKKSLGQHFLKNDLVPGWLCDAADLEVGEVVFEIGPGTGALTRELLKRGVTVYALEADQRAIGVLKNTFAAEIANGQLTVVHGDAKKLDFKAYNFQNQQFKVVANIPYYLSGLLFRSCLSGEIQPNTVVFLVQKEVAKRATENLQNGHKESLLSLSTAVFGTPTFIRTVGRGHFVPPPAVDSAIIAITNISRENFKTVDEALFFKLIHLGFGQKRKQLLGILSTNYNRGLLMHTFSTVGIPEKARAEDISLTLWFKLTQALAVHS